ncbi:hypothetical protein, partial [Methylobacterium longum]
RLWMRNRRRAAEGQRSTSTDQLKWEFARSVGRAEPCANGLQLYDLPNNPRIGKTRLRVHVSMTYRHRTATPEVPANRVEEFADAARQIIDERLRAHEGECPEFWKIVTGLYASMPEEDQLADEKR